MFDIKVKVKHQSKINLKRSQYMNFIIVNVYIEYASERTFFAYFVLSIILTLYSIRNSTYAFF